MANTLDQAHAALRPLHDPQGISLAEGGRIEALTIEGSTLRLTLRITPDEAAAFEPVRQSAEAALVALPGIDKAQVVLTAEKAASPATPPAPQNTPQRPAAISGVTYLLAIASGKGGVGKSTTAANLALALLAQGRKVGLVDADIYGPSVPMLMGTRQKPEFIDGKRLRPILAHGLKVMSIGFMVDDNSPLIWRGPMIDSALTQLLRDVDWGELDVLIIDMPPGTGDAQLTLAQKMPLSGAVIVSTPQDLALIDARKGITLFHKAEIPVLGLIENMAGFVCPSCGFRCDIFGHGGAKSEAQKLDLPFLGEVPLHMSIRIAADAGKPTMVSDPDGVHAAAYLNIAEHIWTRLSKTPEPR